MKHLPKNRRGFSLVEVTLALGVAAFCLIAIFGLLPTGLMSNQTAIEQTAANGILSAVCADLRTTPPTIPPGKDAHSQQFKVLIPANPLNSSQVSTLYFAENGRAVTSAGMARYRLTVTFLSNGSNLKNATFANLQVSWPPETTKPSGLVQTFVALDRN